MLIAGCVRLGARMRAHRTETVMGPDFIAGGRGGTFPPVINERVE
jgi:hypothetical protein